MKVLIVGLGSIGQRHARNLRRLRGRSVDILACRARGRPDVIDEHMAVVPGRSVDEFYGLRTFTSLDLAIAERPDAAIVCTPTSLHVPAARALVEAGCPVLVEKPLGHSWEGVDELLAAAGRRSVVATVGYQLRFHPALLRLRALVAEGAVGRVAGVRAEMGEYLPDAHPYEDYRQGYAARADLGGGVLLSFAHEFDYACWLFGRPRRVFATSPRPGVLGLDVEETAVTVLECERGDEVVPVEVFHSFAQRPPSRTCVVKGDRGSIVVDLNAPSLVWKSAAGAIVSREAFDGCSRNQLFLDELAHFLACVAEGGTPAVPLADAAMSLGVALGARESLRSGRVVELG